MGMGGTKVHVGQPARMADRDRFGLTGPSRRFDPRIVAIRPDLADITVAGTHFAPHYSAAMMRSCVDPRAPVFEHADDNAAQINELLMGEGFALLDITGGWAWGYSLADHRVGFLRADALGAPIAPTHKVVMMDAVIKGDAGAAAIPYGAQLMGDVTGDILTTAQGTIAMTAVAEISERDADPAGVAERFAGTPFHRGGRSAHGIDCSGLVQMAWASAGIALPRDSELQQDGAGDVVSLDELQRDDLVFFTGHSAMMLDSETLIHATHHWGDVRAEPLAEVVARHVGDGGTADAIVAKRLVKP